MAKFCSQCGRPLEDGEICNCTQENNAGGDGMETNNTQTNSTETNSTETKNTQENRAQSDTAAAAKEAAKNAADNGVKYAKNVFAKIGPMFKNPIGEIKRMAAADKLEEPMTLVVLNIVIVFIVSIILMLSLHIRLGKILGDYAMWISIPYVKIVFSLTLIVAAIDFISAGLLLLSAKVFFREETSFAKILSVIGGSLLIQTVALVLGAVVMIVSSWLGSIVIYAGVILSALVQIMSYYEVSTLSMSKKLYSYVVYIVLNAICQSIIIFALLASLLSGLKDALGYLF